MSWELEGFKTEQEAKDKVQYWVDHGMGALLIRPGDRRIPKDKDAKLYYVATWE